MHRIRSKNFIANWHRPPLGAVDTCCRSLLGTRYGTPLPLRKPQGRRKRGGTNAGESAFDIPGGVWNWVILAQVKEGTESKGGIESVVRLVRKTVSELHHPFPDYPDALQLLGMSPPLPLGVNPKKKMHNGGRWSTLEILLCTYSVNKRRSDILLKSKETSVGAVRFDTTKKAYWARRCLRSGLRHQCSGGGRAYTVRSRVNRGEVHVTHNHMRVNCPIDLSTKTPPPPPPPTAMGIRAGVVVCTTSFLLGALFTNWIADSVTLWKSPITDEHLWTAASYYSILAKAPQELLYFLGCITLLGGTTILWSLRDGEAGNLMFDGGSLCVFAKFASLPTHSLKDPIPNNLRTAALDLASNNLICSVALTGVLALQAGRFWRINRRKNRTTTFPKPSPPHHPPKMQPNITPPTPVRNLRADVVTKPTARQFRLFGTYGWCRYVEK
ncbi:Shr3 amino acid permease chaperone [Salix suchowensis]|nr:Shr3 amino acid permease chaperone [Salix suchowensis]